MIRRPPRSTLERSSAASDVYKRQPLSSAAEKCPSQSGFSRKISRSETSFPSRRDSGSKDELSHATTPDAYQSRVLDRGGKQLTVGGRMIALDERGREMPSPSRLFAEYLAQRKLLSFPPGLRVERGDFSGNNARDFPKSEFGPRGQTSYRCLLYTSDAADERSSVDLGGRRIIKKKKKKTAILDE